jgi:hypothetical protein
LERRSGSALRKRMERSACARVEPALDLYAVFCVHEQGGIGIVNVLRALLLAIAAAVVSGCSFENHNEREADRITRAVIDNDLKPVQKDIANGVAITRVKVAQWSDELNGQGKLLSVKETTADCGPGWHCFNVKFQKHNYFERMRFDEHGKVVDWDFHMAPQ